MGQLSNDLRLQYLPHVKLELADIGELIDIVSDRFTTEQRQQVQAAYDLAADAHKTQTRKSGEPYITHPLAVAGLIAQMHMDFPSVCAALMHDVIEDSHYTRNDIAEHFGEEVAELVYSLTKLDHINFQTKAEAKAVNFQRMIIAMARDIRVIIIKMCDRLHNMYTLGIMRPDKRRRISNETLEYYVPIAERLGMNNFKLEFEELCFANKHPNRSRTISATASLVRSRRAESAEQVRDNIQKRLLDEGINARVSVREKHLYGIYQKLQSKGKVEELSDVFNCRIVVDKVDACYRALGIAHSMFKPKPDEIKDYVAIPKQNGYQSLHTVLIGSNGTPIHAQIRTEEMDMLADYGVLAQWMYKRFTPDSPALNQARRWMQGLLEMQQHVGNSIEFVENVRDDLFPDEVYVFTPRGDIIELPNGATPVDFAYKLHTAIGNNCIGCRIDGVMASLNQRLISGQSVEILKHSAAKPQLKWLENAVTGRARSAIKHYLRESAPSARYSDYGTTALEKALKSMGSSLNNYSKELLATYAKEQGKNSFEEICGAIGTGETTAILTARTLIKLAGEETQIDSKLLKEALTLRGDEGSAIRFASCCKPIPGDDVIGHIKANKDIEVHRDRCKVVLDKPADPSETLMLHWADHTIGEFSVDLSINAENIRGIVPRITSVIASGHSDVTGITTVLPNSSEIEINLTVAVHDRHHLAKLMRLTRKINGVQRVSRAQQQHA